MGIDNKNTLEESELTPNNVIEKFGETILIVGNWMSEIVKKIIGKND